MKLLPDSIIGRTVLVLLAGLVGSHLISLAIYSDERLSEMAATGGKRISERIAAAVETVDGTGTARREIVTRALWGPGFSATWTEASVLPADDSGGWRAHIVRSSLDDFLGGVEPDRIRIAYRMPGQETQALGQQDPMRAMQEHMGRMADARQKENRRSVHMQQFWRGGEVLEVSVRLSDGSWLNTASPAVRLRPFWWSQGMLSIILMTLVVIVFSIWAVRRSTVPLALFTQAAERLGHDVNAPPLTEDGPREVRLASIAFNDMQRKLRRFIQDRTQMLAAISHDLRTPITRLRLRAELITDEEQQRKMLSDLQQMEEMISSTLSFARDEATDEVTARFDIAAMLQSLVDDTADSGVLVSYKGPDRVTFRGRSMALKRAFQNLIDNACQYGGRADVVLQRREDMLRVTVSDDGPGIPDDEHEKVFAPFYRLENSRSRETGGVGLGLAVARTAIRAHGGDITMEVRDEGGFQVTIDLPL
ncbi:MAG: sensor histidine kinase [Alphaproteobacteria bacterium]